MAGIHVTITKSAAETAMRYGKTVSKGILEMHKICSEVDSALKRGEIYLARDNETRPFSIFANCPEKENKQLSLIEDRIREIVRDELTPVKR